MSPKTTADSLLCRQIQYNYLSFTSSYMFRSYFDPRRYRKKFNRQDYSAPKISASLYNVMPQDTRLCEIWGSRRSADESLRCVWYSHECLPYQEASHPRRLEFFNTRLDTYIKKRSRTDVTLLYFIVFFKVLYPA